MKKIISVLLVTFMLMTSMCTYADTDAIYTALTSEPLSAKTNMNLSLKLNKPIEFLDNYDMLYAPTADLVNSYMNMQYQAEGVYVMSQDKKKCNYSMEMQFDIPVEVGEDFKADIWAKAGMWLDMDLTDSDNPMYKMIFKTPIDSKYRVMDFSLISDEEEVAAMFEFLNTFWNGENKQDFEKKCYESLKNNFEIKTLGMSKYELSADDKAFKAFLKDIFNIAIEMFGDSDDMNEIKSDIEEGFKYIEDIQILGERGFKTEIVLDGGNISVTKSTIHVCFNMYDILTQFEMEDEEISRESSWIDFDIILDTKMTEINKVSKVDMPYITEENSAQLFEHEMYEDDEEYEEYVSPWCWFYDDGMPVTADGELYIPARSFINELGIDDEKIAYADGVITVDASEENILEFGSLSFTLASCDVYINGERKSLSKPVIAKDGKTYLPSEFLTHINCTIDSYNYDYESNETGIDIYRNHYDYNY